MILVPLLADFTTLKGFLNFGNLDFDIVSDFELRISNLCYINSTNSYVRIYKQIMQNKPNFGNDKMSANTYLTSKYEILSRWRGRKTKPIQSQLKPKQSQFNPIQSQFNPKQTQFKPNLTKGKK